MKKTVNAWPFVMGEGRRGISVASPNGEVDSLFLASNVCYPLCFFTALSLSLLHVGYKCVCFFFFHFSFWGNRVTLPTYVCVFFFSAMLCLFFGGTSTFRVLSIVSLPTGLLC